MSPRYVPLTTGSARFRTQEIGGFRLTQAWFPPLLRLAPHAHDRATLGVMLEGSFDLVFARSTHDVTPWAVTTEPLGERHANRVGRAGAHVLVLEPDPAQEEIARLCAPALGHPGRFRHDGIARMAWRAASEMDAPDAVSPLMIEGLALEMLALGARLQDREPARRPPPVWLRRADELIRARFLDRLTTGEIARAVDVHPVHLARVFRAHHGVALGTFVRSLRLEWAASRLRDPVIPLSDVAAEAGFADQSHFTRAFRRHTGMTPRRYRLRSGS